MSRELKAPDFSLALCLPRRLLLVIKAALCLWARWGRAEGPGRLSHHQGLESPTWTGERRRERLGARGMGGGLSREPVQLLSISGTPVMRQVLCQVVTSSLGLQ